jgi:hypothetical protein
LFFLREPISTTLKKPLAPAARGCVFRRNIIRAPLEAGVDSPQATRAPALGAQGETQSAPFADCARVREISVKAGRDKWRGPVPLIYGGMGRQPFMLTARKFFEPGWGDSTSRKTRFSAF